MKSHIDGYELYSCYCCGEDILIDSNNLDLWGETAYHGDDRLGQLITTCPKHRDDWYRPN